MADKNTKTYVIRGTLHWAKVLGKPRFNEYSGENEWSVDVTPTPEAKTTIRGAGIEDRLKTPKKNDSRTEAFVSFRHREKRKDGDLNAPIRIQDVQGNAWPENKLLGNGTVADVKFTVRDYGRGKPKGVYIQAIRVLDHVPYETVDFAPLDEDDEFFANGSELPSELASEALEDEDLDDDVPF